MNLLCLRMYVYYIVAYFWVLCVIIKLLANVPAALIRRYLLPLRTAVPALSLKIASFSEAFETFHTT